MEPRSVAEVRELLGDEALVMTDAEVEEMQQAMTAFAQVLVGNYRTKTRASRASERRALLDRQDLHAVRDTKGAAR